MTSEWTVLVRCGLCGAWVEIGGLVVHKELRHGDEAGGLISRVAGTPAASSTDLVAWRSSCRT